MSKNMENQMMKELIKPFACTLCSASFSHKFMLEAHIGTHSSVKSHRCDYCSASFVQKVALEKHLLTHLGKYLFGAPTEKVYRSTIDKGPHF